MDFAEMKRVLLAIKRGVLFLLAFALLSALLAIAPAWSKNVQAGKDVMIGAQEVIEDDVYLAGETVTIDGTVKGDAVVAGRSITINGTVEEDLIAAGQAVALNGTVGDDVRMAGEVLLLKESARVADDLIAAGFSLESKAGSIVAGNLKFAGAQALLAGTVEQNLDGAMGAMELRGTVDGNMKVWVGSSKPYQAPFRPEPAIEIPEVPSGLTLTDSAKIGGQFTYKSATEAKISQEAQVAGGIVREEVEEWAEPTPSLTEVIVNQLRRLVTLALVGWLLSWLVPGWTQSLAETVQARPLSSFGWGIVAFLAVGIMGMAIAMVTAILTAIFAFTLQGLILPVIGLGLLAYLTLFIGFLIFSSYVPPIALSFLGGRWLLQKIKPDRSSGRFLPLFVGLVVLVILTGIPVLGGILNLIILFFGLGALWLWGKARLSPVADEQLTT